jgi:nucleoside-diphosphate-sugar epimerase
MRVVVAGAHGRVARRLGRLLVARGDSVVGIVRNPQQEANLAADGIDTVVLDLEGTPADELASIVVMADAIVFAAGAPPEMVHRKDAVDRAAAIRLADAAEEASVRQFLLMSAMGVDAFAAGRPPADADEAALGYLRAKLAAEQGVRARPAVDSTVLRPGRLTDAPGTGRVTLGSRVTEGSVSRDDVAAVILALLDAQVFGATLEVVAGETPVLEAVTAVPSLAGPA